MGTFKILWIDDDWNRPATPSHDSLVEIKSLIEGQNSNIEFTTHNTIPLGITAVRTPTNNFNLVIVDLYYEDDPTSAIYDYSNLIEHLEQLNLPFCVYTSHKRRFENELESVTNGVNTLLMGVYEKGPSTQADFVKDIVSSSRFSQISILHIGDLHYDSTLSGDAAKEQKDMFDSFIDYFSNDNQPTPIDYILFTGDFACKNPCADMEGCVEIIKKLIDKTVKNRHKFLLVPGNHDVDWKNFEEGICSESPGLSMQQFCRKIFDSDDFIANLAGWQPAGESLNLSNLDSFCFAKTDYNKNGGLTKFIGLNSTTQDTGGHGEISDECIKFIQRNWAGKPVANEFRIAFFHHNLMSTFSANRHDEEANIKYAGGVMNTLMNSYCDLLLTGHSHNAGVYNMSISRLGLDGYSAVHSLTTISTNTLGGKTVNGDRPRSFNIITVHPTTDTAQKIIQVTPVFYDSVEKKWSSKKSFTQILSQKKRLPTLPTNSKVVTSH